MKVLVIGSGGREHTIAWKFAQSPQVEEVFVAPGNAGMKDVATLVPISEKEHDALIQFVKENNIELTFVGPEVPLLAGIVDQFEEEGLKIFGPKQRAAELEGSKSFAKDLMKKYNIPTGDYAVFTDFTEAKAYVESKGAPIVIKANGLAAGKGVVVAETVEQAVEALDGMLNREQFGAASASVVVEQFLEGEELSLMAFVHGTTVLPMVGAQDHKRAFDGDQGPNTGGMGAYSPVPQFTDGQLKEAVDSILKPTVKALVDEDRSFTGILYAGLMMTASGPKVIEFNARFGDPETQVVLPRLKTDLVDVVINLLSGEGESIELEWTTKAMLGVVVASDGYPGSYHKGIPLEGLNEINREAYVFHAGTKQGEHGLETNGGRVLLVAAQSESLKGAQEKVYNELKNVPLNGLFYRTDIGHKAISRSFS